MAAIATTLISTVKYGGGALLFYYGTGTSNQSDTMSTPAVDKGGSQRLLYATVNYSGAPTQAGVTVEIDSVIGSTYDSLLHTFTANGQKNTFIPDDELWLAAGDAIRVSAPAGGAFTAACLIVMEAR